MFEHQFLDPAAVLRFFPVAPGMVVGDFGCGGTAAFSRPLARVVGDDGRVVMFDVQKSVVGAAMSAMRIAGFQNVRGVWTDLEVYHGAKDIADASLDGGIMVNLLHESNHHLELLTEVSRMLKPGAELVIVDWEKGTNHPLAPLTNLRLTPAYTVNVAQQAGLAPVESFSPDQDHWGIRLKKT